MTELRYSLLLIVFLLGLPAIADAEESCAQGMGTVCLDAVQSGRSVSISADNHEIYEVTVTVNAVLDNMTASVKLPYTRSLDGKFKGALLTFAANPQGAWRWNYTFHWTPGSVDAHHDDSVVYDLPYIGTHTVMQGFHGTFSHTGDFEYAVDWEMPVGTAVYAAREGIVVGTRSSMTAGGPDRKYQDHANFIMIRHADGTIGSYDHLKEDGVVVKVSDRINRRQLIGYSGNTGFTSGPHLHFFIFRAVDGSTRQSFPMRFQTVSGIITPQQGQSYSSVNFATFPSNERVALAPAPPSATLQTFTWHNSDGYAIADFTIVNPSNGAVAVEGLPCKYFDPTAGQTRSLNAKWKKVVIEPYQASAFKSVNLGYIGPTPQDLSCSG